MQSTAKGSYPYLSGLVAIQCVDIVVGKGGCLGVLVGLEQDVLRPAEISVEAHQSIDCPHPQTSLLVFRDVAHLGIKSIDGVVREAVVFVMECQLSVRVFLHQVQSAIQGAHPYPFFRIDEGVIDIIAADTGRIVFRVAMVCQLIAHRLRTVGGAHNQTVAFGREPQSPAVVLYGVIYGTDAISCIGQCLLQFALGIIDVHITTAGTDQYPSATHLIDVADTRHVIVGQRDKMEGMTRGTDTVEAL